ncbi:hypothetical protein DL89DRAFT_161002 [Linderina pennispora]|uniref:Uncharacterized protein n=1 Tax=Linderina pennispora TaxID=61395 RepID=A0A1Y1W7D9_9FUNG|nr:uncharacterized protein DL89DRAFT_161002 [Linderina pennispora]ORX69441.1 hypothetical protein DL89DRAFT_161002 [Linderina pennispora]
MLEGSSSLIETTSSAGLNPACMFSSPNLGNSGPHTDHSPFLRLSWPPARILLVKGYKIFGKTYVCRAEVENKSPHQRRVSTSPMALCITHQERRVSGYKAKQDTPCLHCRIMAKAEPWRTLSI